MFTSNKTIKGNKGRIISVHGNSKIYTWQQSVQSRLPRTGCQSPVSFTNWLAKMCECVFVFYAVSDIFV